MQKCQIEIKIHNINAKFKRIDCYSIQNIISDDGDIFVQIDKKTNYEKYILISLLR